MLCKRMHFSAGGERVLGVRPQQNLKEEYHMAYIISDDCVSCGACVSECPNDAISEGADKYVIDADACVDCGACADVCPSSAISPA